MSDKNSNYLKQAAEHWRDGQPLDAGRLIFDNLTKEVQPRWAANILKSVVKRTGIKSPPIERIIHLADHPRDWNKANDAFSSARRSTLELESLKARSPEQALLLNHLLLAELVAKVIYN